MKVQRIDIPENSNNIFTILQAGMRKKRQHAKQTLK